MIGIYKISNPSGRIYIGQSWDIEKRWKQHIKSSTNRIVASSINKYGRDRHSFELINELPNDIRQLDMDNLEQAYIDIYKSAGFSLMNLKDAGTSGKMSIETRKKMSESALGKKKSNDTKLRMSKAQSGKKRTIETKTRIKLSKTGIRLTDEHKKKLSSVHKGKIVVWINTENQWRAKRVVDTKTGVVYGTITNAAKAIGINNNTLKAMLRGQNKNKTTLVYDA